MTEVASLAEYGALYGVTKQAAAKWKAREYLVMQGDAVDVLASDARMREAGKGRFSLRAGGASTDNPKRQPSRQPPARLTVDEKVDGLGAEVDGYPFRNHLIDPSDRAAVALLPHTAYRIGGVAALMAYELGMAPEVAERLRLQVAASAMEIVAMILAEAGVQPPPGAEDWSEVPLFDTDKVSTVDWGKMA